MFLLLNVTWQLLRVEFEDVVEVLSNLALSVVHEYYERLAEEFRSTLRVLQEQVAHDSVGSDFVEFA